MSDIKGTVFVRMAACLVGLLLMSAALVARAESVTIHMDEVDAQPVNGLSVAGVTLSYSIDEAPSNDATFNAYGVGTLTYVDDPSLEGSTAGVLHVAFAQAVSRIAFGVALQSEVALDRAVRIRLLDADHREVLDQWISTMPLIDFSEGRFNYDSATSVISMDVSFAQNAPRFILDNLSFSTSLPSPVPEPSTLSMSLLVVIGSLVFRRLPSKLLR